MKSKKTIGYRLSQIRLENDMSLRDMAKAIGVTDTSIMRWEKDKMCPSFLKVIEICRMFNCSLDWLAGMKEEDR